MLLYTLVFAYVCRIASARRNITLDDSNPAIQYHGSWLRTPLDTLNAGGRHMVTANSDAYATLSFTGIAIYFYSPLWPFEVTTAVSLDDSDPSLLDLRDYEVPFVQDGSETAESQIVWYMDGLGNTEHMLNVSVGVGEDLAILDALVYTILEPGDSTKTPTSGSSISQTHTRTVPTSSASSTPYPPTTSSSSTKTGLSITLGLVCTIFGVIVLWAFYWYWRRRQRRLEEDSSSYTGSTHNADMSEANLRLPSYPRTTGLSSAANARRNLVSMADRHKRPPRPPPLQSPRSSARSATRAARRAKKPLSTIPETSIEAGEESTSQGSSIDSTTPDTSPSISPKNNKPDEWMEPDSSEKTTIRLVTDSS